jgi:hypothetical protein
VAQRERLPTDVASDDLVRVYTAGARRLELIMRDLMARGVDPSRYGTPEQLVGDATASYRERNLTVAQGILAGLRDRNPAAAQAAAGRAYGAAVVAVDRVAMRAGLGDSGLLGRFGGIHQATVNALASNLEVSLDRAARAAASNTELVFQRAAALDGPLPTTGRLASVGFLGRRQDDPWRRVALEGIASGQIAGDTRRQVSATLVEALKREGVTDALTGYVDRSGRRWPLEVYAEMVARTTTREATSRATANRLTEHGIDLVTISSHPHAADDCTPYDGRTFALPGSTRAGYRVLDRYPPFHPRCRHVVTPAAVPFDEYLDELERTVNGYPALDPFAPPERTIPRPAPAQPPRRSETPAPVSLPSGDLLTPATPASPPFSPFAEPRTDARSTERLEAQRLADLIGGDPGPEGGAVEARDRARELDARRTQRAFSLAMGEDLSKFVDRSWGKKERIRARLADGELTIEDVQDLALEQYQLEHGRRALREAKAAEREAGTTRAIPCFVCGRFKRRPADRCDWCGDDPVSVDTGTADQHASRQNFNRGYGYAG